MKIVTKVDIEHAGVVTKAGTVLTVEATRLDGRNSVWIVAGGMEVSFYQGEEAPNEPPKFDATINNGPGPKLAVNALVAYGEPPTS